MVESVPPRKASKVPERSESTEKGSEEASFALG